MWSRKALALVTLGTLALLFGLVLADGQSVLIGTAALLFVGLASLRQSVTVRVQRAVPKDRFVEGDRQPIRLTVTNLRNEDTPMLELYDQLSDRVRLVRGSNKRYFYLRPRQERAILYDIQTPLRGVYRLGPIALRHSDFFGLFTEEERIEDIQDISVYPRIEEHAGLFVTSQRLRHYNGPFLTRQVGQSTEFYSMRDYVKGDPLRKINWKATARLRQLMVNEMERENLCDILIMLDAREVNTLGTISTNPLEYSVKAAASLANHYIRRKNQVGLLVYNDSLQMISPGGGESQLSKILTMLMATEGKGDLPFRGAFELSRPYINRRSALILLSGLEFDPTMEETVEAMVAAGFNLTVISPSPAEFEAGLTQTLTEKRDLVLLERENFLEDLQARGVRVIDWQPTETVSALLERVVMGGF